MYMYILKDTGNKKIAVSSERMFTIMSNELSAIMDTS